MFYCGTILENVFPDPNIANKFAVGIQVMQVLNAVSRPRARTCPSRHSNGSVLSRLGVAFTARRDRRIGVVHGRVRPPPDPSLRRHRPGLLCHGPQSHDPPAGTPW